MNFLKNIVGGGGQGTGQRLGGPYPGAAAASSSSSSPRTPGSRSPQRQPPQPSAPSPPPPQGPQVVEVTFMAQEKQLGMTIVPAGHPQGSAAVVGSVALQGTAHGKGVRKGDRVVAVDGNRVQDFDALEASLAAIGRPVTFRFERPTAVGAGAAAAAPLPVAVPVGSAAARAGPPPALSPQDRERAARRAAMAAAAEERNKAWSKKIEGNRAKDRRDDEGRFRAASDPKTLASVARVKAAEQQESIYQSHSFGQSQARARIELSQPAPGLPIVPNGGVGGGFPPSPTRLGQPLGGSGSGSGSGGGSPAAAAFPAPGLVAPPPSFLEAQQEPPPLSREEVESPEALVAEEEFDLALSVLLDQDPDQRRTAMATALQILGNVLRDPFQEKYRRVKTSNAAFQGRVAGCPGGVELLTAAGFAFVADAATGAGADGSGEEETFLAIVEPPPLVPLRARIVYHRLRQTMAHMQEM